MFLAFSCYVLECVFLFVFAIGTLNFLSKYIHRATSIYLSGLESLSRCVNVCTIKVVLIKKKKEIKFLITLKAHIDQLNIRLGN